MKERLDLLLVQRDLCPSREQAQRLIRAGEVMVNQRVIDKPGTEIEATAEIVVKHRSPFVSRGGEKLTKAIAHFQISIVGRICLDGGISTGGFTDCLLQAGASRVYGIDVGYGQVAWELRQNPQLVLKERTNLRHLTPAGLYEPDAPYADLAVVDVSFISLTKVLPALWQLLRSPRELVLLVKPQFEVGKGKVGKKGVVRDLQEQAGAIERVLGAAIALGWHYVGVTWSPLLGPAGNIEYLVWLRQDGTATAPDRETLHRLTQEAQESLTSRSNPTTHPTIDPIG
ncbi:MAG: TlyA family RNA methyltransferase [Leptolyngbyaceae cyanobacterium SL_7_1]|nr:TlyA family RNA methyltransferase [Leptolyngbyaceae cyanobacterium SL_7_1]